LPFGTAEGPAAITVGGVENRSGVVSAGRRVGMPQLCRRWLTAATAGRGYAADLFLEAISLKHCPEARAWRSRTHPPARRRRQGHGRANNISCCLISNAPAVDANTLAVKKHARVRALQHDQRTRLAQASRRRLARESGASCSAFAHVGGLAAD
jgi:hypothetical protein